MSLKTQKRAADQLTHYVMRKLHVHDGSDIVCPREASPDHPCVMKDADDACDKSGTCIGCGASPTELLNELRRH